MAVRFDRASVGWHIRCRRTTVLTSDRHLPEALAPRGHRARRHHPRDTRGQMYNRRDSTDAAARRKAKRERDDASPRLRERVPRLQSLHFEIRVSKDGDDIQAARHVKRFIVEQAPALFVLDCTDQDCRDGGHDLTEIVLRELQTGRERFTAEEPCRGQSGDRQCGRVMQVTAVATYGQAGRGA